MLAVVTLLGEHGDMYRLKLHYSQCTQYCMHKLYRLCIIMNIIRLLLTIPKALAALCPTPKVNTRQPHQVHQLKLGPDY